MGARTYRAVLIGAGNVATRLACALRQAGQGGIAVGGRTRVQPIPADADIYIIAVSDRSIAQVAGELARVGGLVVHTAGSVGMDVLPQQRRGVLYPLQTLSRARQIDFSQVPLFIESDSDLPLLHEVASSLSRSVHVLDSERRRRIHLAAVFCSNFTNAMYSMAHRLLQAEGIPFSVLLPLITETAAKVRDLVPHEAQTGPAVRWDTEVMEAQKALLPDDEMRQVYSLLSNYIHNDKLRFKEDKGTAL